MKILWAPWRMTYIKNPRRPTRCIFCLKAGQRQDESNLMLYRGQWGFVLMNLYPYNNGHLMVAPYAHVDSLELLPKATALDIISLTNLSLRVLRAEMSPEGFNVGVNLGRVSGAGIEEHLHMHIVPRWNGDTNFMPVFSETRVIPELLRETYRKLRARFRTVARQNGRPQRRTATKLTNRAAKRRL